MFYCVQRRQRGFNLKTSCMLPKSLTTRAILAAYRLHIHITCKNNRLLANNNGHMLSLCYTNIVSFDYSLTKK